MSQRPAKDEAEIWLLRRTFRHVFAMLAKPAEKPPPPAKRGRQGKGGHAGGWRAYVGKSRREPGIAAIHHAQKQPERAASLKGGLRRAEATMSRSTDKGTAPSRPSAAKPRGDHAEGLRK